MSNLPKYKGCVINIPYILNDRQVMEILEVIENEIHYYGYKYTTGTCDVTVGPKVEEDV